MLGIRAKPIHLLQEVQGTLTALSQAHMSLLAHYREA